MLDVDYDSQALEGFSTAEIAAYLNTVRGSIRQWGPVGVAAAATRAAEALRGRPKDVYFGRAVFGLAECYRCLLPFSQSFQVDGLDMHRVYRTHAADAYLDALDVFGSLGDELEAARCRAALRDPRW